MGSKSKLTNWKDFRRPVTYIWEIWDLDDTFKEFHFSGTLKELPETAEDRQLTLNDSIGEVKVCYCLIRVMTYPINRSRNRSRCPRRTSGAIPTNQRKWWIYDLIWHSEVWSSKIKNNQIPKSRTAVELEHQQDREVVEKAAVQDEGYQRSQSALSSWSRGFGPIGIQLTQNLKETLRSN